MFFFENLTLTSDSDLLGPETADMIFSGLENNQILRTIDIGPTVTTHSLLIQCFEYRMQKLMWKDLNGVIPNPFWKKTLRVFQEEKKCRKVGVNWMFLHNL